jgi:hypothetical protein
MRFQKRQGVRASGVLDAATVSAISDAVIGLYEAQRAETEAGPPATCQARHGDLCVVSSQAISGEYNRYVGGVVRNYGNHTYSYVQVEINLYDNAGNQVGSALDNTTNLEPHSEWHFKAVTIQDEASKFRVMAITGW